VLTGSPRAERGLSRFPVISAAVLVLHFAWNAGCIVAILRIEPSCTEGCWGQLVVFLVWTLGEVVLAVPALVALTYAVYSWNTSERKTAPLNSIVILVTIVATMIPLTAGLVGAGVWVLGPTFS